MEKSIGKEFMEKTKYKYLTAPDQKKGLPKPPLELDFDKTKKLIDLPKPKELKLEKKDLRELLEKRVSVREYDEKLLTLNELAWLCWATQGVKEISEVYTKRIVPSAGARHAFETYLLINKVEGFKPGLYRYLALEHKLIEITTEKDIADRLTDAAYEQTMVKKSAVTFIWIAVPYRMTWRYGERGYRYMHLDAGHVCQNLYFAGEYIECGVCAIAAYYDEKINEVLNLDGEQQFVIYLAAVGKKLKK